MKHTEKRVRPAEEYEGVSHLTCDLCGARTREGDPDNWGRSGGYHDLKTTIELKEGTNYPEGGWSKDIIVDICPKCFREKLLPWLESQGAKPRKESSDW